MNEDEYFDTFDYIDDEESTIADEWDNRSALTEDDLWLDI